jgi:hypothetical protein
MQRYKPSQFRMVAFEVIQAIVKANPNSENLVKLIDAAYPFGERANFPYKVWLEERKKVLIRLNLYKVPRNRKCQYHPDGQTCLICQNFG